MRVQVGYPDHWKDYSKVQLRRDAFWANVAQLRKFIADDVRRQAGKPTDREGWQLPPSSAAAYLDPQINEIVAPAGFLQPPYFDVEATDAMNYGALGSGLAHDMTHAFDATGAVVDATGRAQLWWTDADQHEFQTRAQCIVDQYEGYAIEPGVHHQGKLVLNEALGDQAGVHFAYVAFKKSLVTHPLPTVDQPAPPGGSAAARGQAPVVDGFTPEQQFFLAWAQFRGDAVRIEAQRNLVKADIHAMPRFRVIGPLSNLPEFAQAFSCKAGAAMVRPSEQRCAVW
jgi:endothelin-converting enzyme/putative endopeptidase